MVIFDLDIWHAAKLLIEQHGVEAEKVAIGRAEEMNEQNDLGSMIIWLRIIDAIRELRTPPTGLPN